MAKNDNLKDFLTDVADAIREKKGTEDLINPQDFSDEIKNLPSGSSPFAVDFGEEIATMAPSTLASLQEDIDYYNEIQRKRASGEVADNVLVSDVEFRRRIAWIPKGMNVNDTGLLSCVNLRVWNLPFVAIMYNNVPYQAQLEKLDVDASMVTRLGIFLGGGYVKEINLSFDSLTKIEQQTLQNLCCKKLILNFPNVTNIAVNTLYQLWGTEYADIKLPKVTSMSNCVRALGQTKELHLDISSLLTASYSVYALSNLEKGYIKGIQCSLNISANKLQIESVKYMLDNCQQRADGASYTLTLSAAVKAAFLAKCDEDAEYAASLASATEKGLTLA